MRKKIFLALGLSLVFLVSFKETAFGTWDPYSGSYFGLPDASIYDIIENILGWLLSIVGFAGVIGFVISGFIYLTSAGDDDRIKTAKKAMTASIIGVIVAISGGIVLVAADAILNAFSYF